MNRLIWKELREHFKLALVAMLGLGAAELSALFQGSNDRGYVDTNHAVTLMRDSLLLVTTFGPAAIGLLLGFVQILPELKRDRWATLLHLPTPRSHLFFGKAAAGVLLYALATIPPFLTCVYLAATPGNFVVPFVPGLALPGIADTLTGLTYYFAALLMALQRGGGFGLRALPLFAAIHVTSFAHETNEFQLAAWAAVLMAVCLYAAGCGAMIHRDQWTARPWLTRLAILIVAFYGLCGLGGLFRQAAYAGSNFKYDGSSYEFAEDGRPLKLIYQKSVVVSVLELDGSTPKETIYRPDSVRSHVRYLNPFISSSKRFAPSDPYRVLLTYLYASQPFSHPQPELWFQLAEQRYLIGFSQQTKKPTAIFDENGFHPASSTPIPFPAGVNVEASGGYGFCLWSPERVRFLDLPSRKVTEISLPVPGPVSGMTHALSNATTGTAQTAALELPTGVAFYDETSGQLVAMVPYHQDITRYGALSVGSSAKLDRFYLWYRPTYDAEVQSHNTLPSYLEESDTQGRVLRTYTLPPLPRREFFTWQFAKVAAYGQSPAFYFGSLLYHQIGIGLGNEHLRWELSRSVFNRQLQPQHAAWGIIRLSLLCAAITLAWARHAQFTWTQSLRWAGLALALNFAGLILFRLIADWPRLLPCAACHQRRPITQSTCPHCAEGWPAITSTGAEIFDHSDVSASPSAASV